MMQTFWLNVLSALLGMFFICAAEDDASRYRRCAYATAGVLLLAPPLIRLWIAAVLA